MRGTASPPSRRGPTPPETMGSCPPVARSFSPARLRAVGAGPPAHHAGGPSPLALRRARRPGLRAPRTAPRETIASARHFTMPAARPACGPPRLPAPPVARTTQASARAANKRRRPPVALDKLPLTLVSAETRICPQEAQEHPLMPRLRREALCCIPGSAGRDLEGGSWV